MPRTRAVFDLTGQKGPSSVTGRVNYVGKIAVIESLQDRTCLAHNSLGNDFNEGCTRAFVHEFRRVWLVQSQQGIGNYGLHPEPV